MEILLLCIGKTDENKFVDLIEQYNKRINHYITFKFEVILENKIKKKSRPEQKILEEAKLLQKKIKQGDHVILLDAMGKEFTSVAFAKKIEHKMVSGTRRIVFIVGGAFGFSEQFKATHKERLSLSKMTFSHQMIRLFFCEQLYRALTIINNHPYHNS